jgi:endonuclease/exonuclease/phosphatase family metal-dependent hydrolase
MAVRFQVMTWNLENLFLVGDASGPKTNEIYEQKMKNLVATISNIAPDVLAVQEVGNPAAFTDLQQRLGGRYPHAQLSEHPDLRGIRVGFLARFPLLLSEQLFEFPTQAITSLPDGQGNTIRHMGRGALKVSVEILSGLTVHIVTAHLKSKLITYPNGRRAPKDENERARETGVALLKRTAEAVALRVYTNQLVTHNSEPLILLGDLNDGPDAATTQLLLGPEDFSLAKRDKGDDVRLYNLAEYIPAPRRHSRIYHKKQELIDHIMVSHELIFQVQKVDSFVEPIEGIGDGLETRQKAVFPDHAPLFALFEIPEPN